MHTLYLYKDMSTRDLLQQRITISNGDTVWHNSPLINACLTGDIIVLDGIHRLRDETLMSIRRLIQDRELDLADGSKLLRHDKYDALMKEANADNSNKLGNGKVLRIHPSFRLIATAEPPASKSTVSTDDKSKGNGKSMSVKSGADWLNSETLNLFLFHSLEALETKFEQQILSRKFKLNKQHDRLFDLIRQLRETSGDEVQLKHISKLFSLRKLIRLSHGLEKYPNQSLMNQIEDACLFKFMPQLNRQLFADFLAKNEFDLGAVSESSSEQVEQSLRQRVQQLAEFSGQDGGQQSLNEISKIPDTLFFENPLHTKILNNMLRDFELGEHLLLIGNQGMEFQTHFTEK